MNNWKLRSTITGQNGMDFVEVNGHLASLDSGEDTLVQIVPFGDKYPYFLRTSASDDFGPVSNQVPGICNGTFTHTGAANGQVASTALTGEGLGATFFYGFLADGTLSFIKAATGGSNYKVGDKLQITTNQGHVIQFRLVDGSNMRALAIRLIHDQGVLPYPVHRVKITETDQDHTIQVLDYRSQQVFPKPQDKLLDKFPNAAAAYGLRLLRSAYLGPAIKVRRDSDNATKDIGFSGENLDTATLLAFAGSQTVTVDTWYDQAGGVNDASQSGTSNQPTIVNAGTLVTVNGKPALDFDGSDDKFSLNHSDLYGQARFDAYFHIQSDDTQYLMFSQSTSAGNHSFAILDGSDSTALSSGYNYTTTDMYVNGVNMNFVSGTTTRDDLHTAFITNGAKHSTGAIIVHEGAQTGNWSNFKVSAYASYAFDGKMTEMVLYNTDQSANRENIEKDMALHSGAYEVEDAPLLDAYGGAHAAYSLRKLNSDYTGAAIRVRRLSDNSEFDIGFKADGTLDTDATDALNDGSSIVAKTWYDQSGNGKHVTATPSGVEPVLYFEGDLLTVDGRPALRFVNDRMPFDSTGLDIGNLSSFMVCKFSNTAGTQFPLVLSTTTGNKRFYPPFLNNGNFNYAYGSHSAAGTVTGNILNNLHTQIAGATQGDMEAFLNGTSVGSVALDSGIDASFSDGIGAVNGANFFNGSMQEIIVYPSDQSERRTGIERNISNHYEL